jgi:Flp pilus assembly protein TadD
LPRRVTPPLLPNALPSADDGRSNSVSRIVFGLGTGAFVVTCLLGVVQSFRSDRRLPAANVLVDGPAEHVEMLLRDKKYDQAIRALAEYENMSNDRLPHERVGQVLGTLDAADARQVAEALRKYPRYTRGRYQLGLALLQAEDYPGAQTEFEAVLEKDPSDAAAHNGLGLALAYQARGEEAAAHFWNALRLRPDFAEPRINLGAIEPLLNRKPAAETAPEASPEPES